MNRIQLTIPSLEYQVQLENFRQVFLNTNDSMNGSNGLRNADSIASWVDSIRQLREGLHDTLVPSDTFLAIRKTDNKLVGIIDARHFLNDYLEKYGGHIGYCIIPDERGKGYAKEMLGLIIEHCKLKKYQSLLVICEEDNFASIAVIRSYNGKIHSNYIDRSCSYY